MYTLFYHRCFAILAAVMVTGSTPEAHAKAFGYIFSGILEMTCKHAAFTWYIGAEHVKVTAPEITLLFP